MTSAEIDIPLSEGGDVHSVAREPRTKPTEDELLAMTKLEQLRIPLLAEVSDRFSPTDAGLTMDAFDIMATQHVGQKRRNGSEAAVHPALVGYFDLLANRDLTVGQLVTDFFHDLVEDCGLEPKDIRDLLTMKGFADDRAGEIALGVYALSRKEDGKKLSNQAYLRKLTSVATLVPHLKLFDRKTGDTTHNLLSDIRQLQTDPESIDHDRASRYLSRKASSVLTLAQHYAPNTPNTRRLSTTMDRCTDALTRASQFTLSGRTQPMFRGPA